MPRLLNQGTQQLGQPQQPQQTLGQQPPGQQPLGQPTGGQIPPTPPGTQQPPKEFTPTGFVGNIFKSGFQLGKDIYTAFRHPIQTVKGIAGVAAGGISKFIPGEQKSEAAFDAVVDFYKERYGDIDSVVRTAYTDPVGVAADIASIFMAGGAALKATKAGGLARAGAKLGKIGRAVEPLTAVGKGIKIATKPLTKGISKLTGASLGITTGVGTGALDIAFRNPTKEFTQALRGKTSGVDILSQAREAFHTIKSNRQTIYQSKLKDVAKIGQKINIDDFKRFASSKLDDFGIKRTKTGLNFRGSKIGDLAEQKRISEVMGRVDDWGKQAGDLTPIGLDNLKSQIGDFYTPSKQGRALIASVRKNLDDLLDKEVKGYSEMTKSYRDASNVINEIDNALSLGDKKSTTSAINKLASSIRDNNEYRNALLRQLEDVSKLDLQGQIAGKALNNLVPSGLIGRSIFAGGGLINFGISGVAGLLSPSTWVPVGISSPRLVGEVLRGLGISNKYRTQMISKLKDFGVFEAIPPVSAGTVQAGRVNLQTQSTETPQ